EGLAVVVPSEAQISTCHRIRHLNPNAARYLMYIHHTGHEDLVDPGDYTNFETHLDPCRQPVINDLAERIAALENVDRRDNSFSVRGLEFARIAGSEVVFGIDQKHVAGESHLAEIEALASGIGCMGNAGATDRLDPLYMRNPEAWLELQVRSKIDQIDANLHSKPVYGQVPQFAAGERSVIDLLAASRDGQLAVIEIKADQDIHLPLQALDYWMRVKW